MLPMLLIIYFCSSSFLKSTKQTSHRNPPQTPSSRSTLLPPLHSHLSRQVLARGFPDLLGGPCGAAGLYDGGLLRVRGAQKPWGVGMSRLVEAGAQIASKAGPIVIIVPFVMVRPGATGNYI